jgi:8-oxo-dGTP diphosphatase
MSAVEAAGAIVFSRAGDEIFVLVVRRARPPREGSWTIPGGRIEPGETASAAARREVREETGIDVAVVAETEVFVLDPYVIHEHVCVAASPAPPLRPGDDAADARWALLSELEALGVHEDARAVIARAAAWYYPPR